MTVQNTLFEMWQNSLVGHFSGQIKLVRVCKLYFNIIIIFTGSTGPQVPLVKETPKY